MATTTLESKPSVWERPLNEVIALDWEKALYIVLILAAFVTRFYDLGVRVMSHDESLHTQYAWYLYEGRGFQHSPLMHGPFKFEVTAFFYWLLGDNDFTARIPTALMGVAAVGLFYHFRKWLGRAGALAGAVMMLISPYMLYYSRYIRDEPYVVTWGMLVALCVINYMETRAAKYLYWLSAISALFYATMEASFIYIAITMLFLGLHVVRELFAVSWPNMEDRRYFQIAFAVTLAAVLTTVISLFLSRAGGEISGTATAAPADPNAPLTTGAAGSPLSGVMLLAMMVAGGGLLAGTFFVFRAFGEELRRFPVLDVLMVLGLFVLPQLTAFPVRALGRNPINYTLPQTTNLGQLLNSDAGVTAVVLLLLLAASAVIGWLWDWKKFLICAGIFYGLYIPLFTTFFTNGGGIATGIVGSLGYWLEQHGVRRGNQPPYYYILINLPIYEFLPALGALLAAGLGAWRWWSKRPAQDEAAARPISPSDTLGFPVIGYFGFWAVLSIIAFSWAGEKMPWLTTHMALPLILVAAWGIGQLIDSIDWQKFREQRGLLLVAILPLTVVAVLMTLGALLGANPPAQGSELPQQQATLAFGSAFVVALIGLASVYYLGRDLGWGNVARLAGLSFFGLLALVTARAAFIAAYVNYDDANEYLVYAHGGRGVKTMMAQIEDISMRTTGGLGLKVAYDDKWSWPGSWYLRDYSNQAYYGVQPTRDQLDAPVVIAAPEHYDKVERLLKDNYYQFEYLRMVWPMQDYFNWDNPADGLPLAPGDCHTSTENMSDERKAICNNIAGGIWRNGKYRQALWNIWWDRDYTLYGELTNQTFDLSNWPVADKVKLYVRKDVAAQIWPYGVGPAVLTSTVVAEYPPDKKQVVVAVQVWGGVGAGSDQSQFRKPRGLAVGPDGSVYVADANNHRIQKFDAEGNFLLAWGGQGVLDAGAGDPGKFNEPWGVAVGPDGSVYVADTWNHRVQKFDANGNFITMWGRFGNDEAPDAFWGPRGIAVGPDGKVYVADTGNKRIAVFDPNGANLDTIGSGGFDPGLFDEPVGLAFAPNGTLYVADTWNQRIQMLTPNAAGEYVFAKEWEVLGWFGQGIENKPFLAVDEQSRVYVTDPENYRVLAFDAAGNFLAMWGDYGFDPTTFNLPLGIAVDAAGNIYVTDSGSEEDGNQRVLKFPPLP
jgi:uncharacterized protein (TIGR03663 family)